MTDLMTMLQNLRRPRLLIRAARHGVEEYRRDLHLTRILGASAPRRSAPAMMRLMELEAEINTARLAESAAYSVSRHVDVLIALMGEARLLRAAK